MAQLRLLPAETAYAYPSPVGGAVCPSTERPQQLMEPCCVVTQEKVLPAAA